MQTRQADKDDVQRIAQIWHLGWHSGHAAVVDNELVGLRVPEEFVARTQAHLSRTHVALVDGQIIGFFMIKGDELYQFYLDAAHHGSGIARELMSATELAMAGRAAYLACTVGNERAAAFYRKCGWKHVRTGPYEAETSRGVFVVQEWRFEKAL